MSDKKPRIEVKPEAAGEPKYYTSPQQMEAEGNPKLEPSEANPDVREELLEAGVDAGPPTRFPWRTEPPEPGLRPLEPLEPLGDDADRIGDAMSPDRIMPPMMPTAELVREPSAVGEVQPRLRGFTRQVEPLRFTCPYGLGGQCCGCRYMPCNELTLAVLGHVSRDYGPGGRCSADD